MCLVIEKKRRRGPCHVTKAESLCISIDWINIGHFCFFARKWHVKATVTCTDEQWSLRMERNEVWREACCSGRASAWLEHSPSLSPVCLFRHETLLIRPWTECDVWYSSIYSILACLSGRLTALFSGRGVHTGRLQPLRYRTLAPSCLSQLPWGPYPKRLSCSEKPSRKGFASDSGSHLLLHYSGPMCFLILIYHLKEVEISF